MFLLIAIILFLVMILNWGRKRERDRLQRSLGATDDDASAVTSFVVGSSIAATGTGLATDTGSGSATIIGPARIYVMPGAKLGLNFSPDDDEEEAADRINDPESGDANDEEEKQ